MIRAPRAQNSIVDMTYPRVPARAVAAVFAVLTVGSVVTEAVGAAVRGQTIPLQVTVARHSFIWLLFGVLSFAALHVARRFPLERARLVTNLPVHLATFAAISMTHTVLYNAFIHFVLRVDRQPDFGVGLALSIPANLRGDVFLYGMMIGAYYLYALVVRQREAAAAVTAAPVAEPVSHIRRIPLKEDGRVGFVDTADVESIEADGDYVRINGRFGSRVLRQPLSALEKQLDPREFARIHRSTIVSLSSIRELQPYFHGEFVAVMSSGARLKVSRTHRSALTTALGVRG
ncbi:MAG: LytR/AlgR family response regulator transcription factor [Gemmatimonadaceae bacterium]